MKDFWVVIFLKMYQGCSTLASGDVALGTYFARWNSVNITESLQCVYKSLFGIGLSCKGLS